MIWKGKGVVSSEEREPCLRSCWECNSAHEHLKSVNALHLCFACGRYWVFDRYMDSFKNDEELDQFFAGLGMKPGDSTTRIDKGYRVSVFTLKPEV